MISLFRTLSLAYIAQHQVRTLLVVLSITLGVAVLVATQGLARGLKRGVQEGVNPLASLADLLIVKGGAGVPASLADELRDARLPGISEIRPFLYARVSTVELDNRPTWLFGIETPATLTDAAALLQDNPLKIKTQLRTPRVLELPRWSVALAKGEVALVSPDLIDALQKRGLDASWLRLRNAGRTPRFLIVGTVDFRESELPISSSVVVLPLRQASALCFPGQEVRVQQINIRLESGADLSRVQAEVQRWLGDRADVQTVQTNRDMVSNVSSGLEMGMLIGSAGALVVGLFLVYNALSVSVAERRHDIGILRAVGATRGQIAQLFLLESLVMGVVGSSVGVPLGCFLSWLAIKPLAGVISELLVPIENVSIQLPWWLMFAAILAGTLVAVLAALVPALQAAQEEPAHAVRRVPLHSTLGATLVHLAVVLLLLGAGTAAAVFRTSLPPLVGVFAGIILLLVGALALTPLLAAVLGRLAQPLIRSVLGLEGRLAADNLIRTPVRTGIVIAALAATTGLLIQTSGFLKSAREAIQTWVEEKIAADLFVSCGSSVTSGGSALTMDPSLGDKLASYPEVDIVLPVRLQRLDFTSPIDGQVKIIWLVALDLAALDRGTTRPALAQGFARLPRLRQPGTVAVSENFARLYGVKVGERLSLPGKDGNLEVEVVGTVVDYTWNRGTVVMNLPWYREKFGDSQVDIFDVFLKPGSDLQAVKSTFKKRFEQSEAVFVVDRPEVYREVNAGLNNIYSLAYAQQVVIGLVALLGVISALFISVLQQKRQLGLLRAVGATRTQVLRLVLAEALLMGMIGALIGIVIGLGLQWYVIYVMVLDESGFLFPMRIPWIEGGVVCLACMFCAALAGLWPASWATGLRIPEAIAYE
ncbi:MAG: FtsX-like permease family protein [Gemmataceae bacterium]